MSDEPKGDGADEAELDRLIEADVAAVRAGQTLETAPQGQTGETGPTGPTGEAPTGESAPTGETGSTGEAPTGEASATGETGESAIRVPNQGKFESDEAFEKRTELFDLVKARKAATTPEAKAALTESIKKAKGELKDIGGAGRFIQRTEGTATGETGEIDPELAADQERLRQLGGATKEDIAAIIAQTEFNATVRNDLQSFVGRHPDLKDEDMREVFFQFVDESYVWQGKQGKDLMGTLEMAYNNMFPPAESVQQRVLDAAGVQKKVGVMAFPGGTGAQKTYSPEMQKSIDELKATGMSEEKAVELLSDL